MKKRFATMALALVMACSLAIPAGAVGVEKSDATVAVISSPLYTTNGYVALRYNGITE